MAYSKGKCKVCGHTVQVGSEDMPPGIAAEGVMESIQEHIFTDHCDESLELVEGDYESVGSAWEHV